MRFLVILIGLVFLLSACGNNEAYENQISNLQNELKAMQEQMLAIQESNSEKSKTELDATGIAIVDMEKLLSQYKGYKDADSRYNSVINRYGDELKKMEEELKARYTMIQKDAQQFGEDFVKDDVVEFQKFQQEAYEKERELTQKSQQLEAEMLRDVLKKVNAHSKEYAETNGFKMILFTSVENGIFYANDEINITEEYIANLNEAYSAGN